MIPTIVGISGTPVYVGVLGTERTLREALNVEIVVSDLDDVPVLVSNASERTEIGDIAA